jgi:hypothetical protein
MAMDVSQLSLNTREGFIRVFNHGKNLCSNWHILPNELPVSLVVEDLIDADCNPCSVLPIQPILDFS